MYRLLLHRALSPLQVCLGHLLLVLLVLLIIPELTLRKYLINSIFRLPSFLGSILKSLEARMEGLVVSS